MRQERSGNRVRQLMNLAEREGKPETELRGNVTEKIILERTEMFDQTDSVIHFYMINSHLCLVSVFLCCPGLG